MSVITMFIYLLSADDIAAVNQFNLENQNGNPVLIASVMDYGIGPCLDTEVLDDPLYIDLRNALDAIVPISERTVTEYEYTSPF